MKNVFTVAIDDNGEIVFDCPEGLCLSEDDAHKNPVGFCRDLQRTIASLVKILWKNKDTRVSTMIRSLSMAEICAGEQPYLQTEELWEVMSMSFLPFMEEFTLKEKRKYTEKLPEIVRPSHMEAPLDLEDDEYFEDFDPWPYSDGIDDLTEQLEMMEIAERMAREGADVFPAKKPRSGGKRKKAN